MGAVAVLLGGGAEERVRPGSEWEGEELVFPIANRCWRWRERRERGED